MPSTLCGFKQNIGMDFTGAQSCCCIGGEIGIASASDKDDDISFCQGSASPCCQLICFSRPAGIRGRSSCALAGHPACSSACLQDNSIHQRGQHPDLIGRRARHPSPFSLNAAENVASANDDADFDPCDESFDRLQVQKIMLIEP